MLSSEECRREADKCRDAATRTRTPGDRAVLLRLAAQWVGIAEARTDAARTAHALLGG